jgi:hypothetical protein
MRCSPGKQPPPELCVKLTLQVAPRRDAIDGVEVEEQGGKTLSGQPLRHPFRRDLVTTAMTDKQRRHGGPFGELTQRLVEGLAAFDHTFLWRRDVGTE